MSNEEKMDCDTPSDDRVSEQKPVAMEVDETVLNTANKETDQLSSKGLYLQLINNQSLHFFLKVLHHLWRSLLVVVMITMILSLSR